MTHIKIQIMVLCSVAALASCRNTYNEHAKSASASSEGSAPSSEPEKQKSVLSSNGNNCDGKVFRKNVWMKFIEAIQNPDPNILREFTFKFRTQGIGGIGALEKQRWRECEAIYLREGIFGSIERIGCFELGLRGADSNVGAVEKKIFDPNREGEIYSAADMAAQINDPNALLILVDPNYFITVVEPGVVDGPLAAAIGRSLRDGDANRLFMFIPGASEYARAAAGSESCHSPAAVSYHVSGQRDFHPPDPNDPGAWARDMKEWISFDLEQIRKHGTALGIDWANVHSDVQLCEWQEMGNVEWSFLLSSRDRGVTMQIMVDVRLGRLFGPMCGFQYRPPRVEKELVRAVIDTLRDGNAKRLNPFVAVASEVRHYPLDIIERRLVMEWDQWLYEEIQRGVNDVRAKGAEGHIDWSRAEVEPLGTCDAFNEREMDRNMQPTDADLANGWRFVGLVVGVTDASRTLKVNVPILKKGNCARLRAPWRVISDD